MLPTWQVDGQSCLIVGVSGDHSMAGQRRRTTHAATFEERMAEEARRFREAAKDLPSGSFAQELLLRRARQAERHPISPIDSSLPAYDGHRSWQNGLTGKRGNPVQLVDPFIPEPHTRRRRLRDRFPRTMSPLPQRWRRL